jgi:signal transduction histidine kinase
MPFIPFNYYTISLLIGTFTAVISGVIVFFNNPKKSENQAWFALTICMAIWSFAYFAMTVASSVANGMLSNWVLHYAAIYIPLFYYLLTLTITDRVKRNMYFFGFFSLCALVFTLINPLQIFVSSVVPKVGFNFAPVPGPAYVYFFIYFVVLVTFGLFTTGKAALETSNKRIRLRLIYTMLFTLAASIGGGSVFLTTFYANIPPYALILFSLSPAISGYAILRHQLFDVKMITTQVLIFVAWIFIFIRTLLSESVHEEIINGLLLVVTIFLGIFLIRNVKKEIAQREHIEKLAKDLEAANVRLTELDRQKSEFVSFATHQLRAPLTAMKGYASMILDGDMGTMSDDAKLGVSRIYDSAKTLTAIVDDYLNITRIELGTMKYAFETVDWKALIEDILGELKPNIEKSGLKFSFKVDNENMDYHITADRDKFKQVIANLIDNSMKYTPKGSVDLSLSFDRAHHKFVFKIVDTGIGIAPEVLPHLFMKWSRAGNANKTNIKGTGLGLYVVKEIITAHHGDVHAESEGEGKGSTFVVEMEPFGKI